MGGWGGGGGDVVISYVAVAMSSDVIHSDFREVWFNILEQGSRTLLATKGIKGRRGFSNKEVN